MEIVLNFEKKEIAVNEKFNFVDLNKRLKKMLGSDLIKWDIVGAETKWIHQYYPTIIYYEPVPITWTPTTHSPYEITYGDQTIYDTIVCFSDNNDDEKTKV